MKSAHTAVHGFVTPALDGPPTGGTLYNAQLIAALERAGVACRSWTLETLPDGAGQAADVLWIDSLYLDALPELRARAGGARLQLVLHYLPSLVAHGRAVTRAELSAPELRALELAQGFLVTSPTMRAALAALGAGERPVLCVEPAAECASEPLAALRSASAGVAALMLCSVVEGKGVLPLLRALAAQARPGDPFTLSIAGRTDLEPAYAAECAALLAGSAELRGRVHVLGPLPHARALAELRAADVLVSASRMEAYGMALAEARACGVPIVARPGGHAAAHVDPGAGGELVADEPAVAASLLALAREPAELAERKRRALAGARRRTWARAAAEWIAGTAELVPDRR